MADTTKQGISSIGVTVKLGTNALNNVQEISDIGGTPSELDATCLKDTMKKSVPGVREGSTIEITYLFDNTSAASDYRKVKALDTAGSATAIEISYPDGTKFANTGYVSTYTQGAKVNELLIAKAIVSLQSEWTVTNPSTT